MEMDSKGMYHPKVYWFTEGREISTQIHLLKPGDIFRKEGEEGWWKCIGKPHFDESTNRWDVDAISHQMLLENK